MAIDKRENSVHVRLGDEDDARLEFLAQAGGSDKFKVAADLLHRALLGEGYDLIVAAERFLRSGSSGSNRE